MAAPYLKIFRVTAREEDEIVSTPNEPHVHEFTAPFISYTENCYLFPF